MSPRILHFVEKVEGISTQKGNKVEESTDISRDGQQWALKISIGEGI
jgi:hypothetical protein